MTPSDLEKLWEEHLAGEFRTKDVESTLATMTDDASVDHVPVHSGGRGKQALRVFYRDVFIPSWPDDLQQSTTNRVVGHDQLVEEIHMRFTHDRPMEWFLPGVRPTGKVVDVDLIVVVQFRGDKITCERIYWDQATVLHRSACCSKPSREGRDLLKSHGRVGPLSKIDVLRRRRFARPQGIRPLSWAVLHGLSVY